LQVMQGGAKVKNGKSFRAINWPQICSEKKM
jgi:hypothetical protein